MDDFLVRLWKGCVPGYTTPPADEPRHDLPLGALPAAAEPVAAGGPGAAQGPPKEAVPPTSRLSRIVVSRRKADPYGTMRLKGLAESRYYSVSISLIAMDCTPYTRRLQVGIANFTVLLY